jgi:hypothetical protein
MWEVHAGVGVKGVQGRTRAYKDRRDEVTTMIPQLDEGRRRSGSVEIRVGRDQGRSSIYKASESDEEDQL